MQVPIAERGRKLMMLRRPEIRERLATTNVGPIEELLECYDLAIAARDRFAVDTKTASLYVEYVQICLELEEEVARSLGAEALSSEKPASTRHERK